MRLAGELRGFVRGALLMALACNLFDVATRGRCSVPGALLLIGLALAAAVLL